MLRGGMMNFSLLMDLVEFLWQLYNRMTIDEKQYFNHLINRVEEDIMEEEHER